MAIGFESRRVHEFTEWSDGPTGEFSLMCVQTEHHQPSSQLVGWVNARVISPIERFDN